MHRLNLPKSYSQIAETMNTEYNIQKYMSFSSSFFLLQLNGSKKSIFEVSFKMCLNVKDNKPIKHYPYILLVCIVNVFTSVGKYMAFNELIMIASYVSFPWITTLILISSWILTTQMNLMALLLCKFLKFYLVSCTFS